MHAEEILEIIFACPAVPPQLSRACSLPPKASANRTKHRCRACTRCTVYHRESSPGVVAAGVLGAGVLGVGDWEVTGGAVVCRHTAHIITAPDDPGQRTLICPLKRIACGPATDRSHAGRLRPTWGSGCRHSDDRRG